MMSVAMKRFYLVCAFIFALPSYVAAELTLNAPSSVTIARGAADTFVASVTSTRTIRVNFNFSGTLPKGVTFKRTPVQCNPNPSCSSTFTVNVHKSTTNPGDYPLSLRATDGKYTARQTVQLIVPGPPPPPPPPSPPPPPPPPPPGDYEGFGSQTAGGAGKPVVRVTNLNNSGAGSLRDALSAGDRMVVFDVAGEIQLSSVLRILGANVTLDGCTAPSPGISLIGHTLEMRGNYGSHDIIVQCIRSRNSINDGIAIFEGAFNIVIDRVSVANSGDGAIDITGWNGWTHDVTVQQSIMSQTNKIMLIKYAPVGRISLHHNLFEGSVDRNPRIGFNDQSTTPMPSATEIVADMRNNLVTNWRGGAGTNIECGSKANVVNNYYSNPGFSTNDQMQAIWLYNNTQLVNCQRGFAYVEGNVSADNVPDINNGLYIQAPKESAPFPAPAITEQSACGAAKIVLQQAGHPIRDAVDAAIVARVKINC